MKLSRTVHFNPALVALVPFVTVLFLVMMFFVLSTRFVLQPGMALTLPYSPFILGPQPNPQILSITAIPVPTIYFRDQKLTLSELRGALARLPNKQRTLVVKADRGTPYDIVVSVMNTGLQEGYSVVLATSEQPQ